jgi:hypothetical protein
MKTIHGMLCLSLTLFSLGLQAQDGEKGIRAGEANRANIQGQFLGSGTLLSDDVTLMPELTHRISKNESEDQEALEELKKELNKQKMAAIAAGNSNETVKKTRTPSPIVATGYNALGNQGTPSDNTIAVNKNNQIICVVNSSLRTYNATTGASLAAVKGLASFFTNLSNSTLASTTLCDPKVIFDPQIEKFILFAQTCEGNSSSSQLLLAFSQTSDPTGLWNLYGFTGNPSSSIGQNVWFDYPKIGVSNSDVFVSGNLFNDNMNYVQSVFYQINKIKCFAGQSLTNADAIIWYNISNDPFTMVPMTNGQSGGYGNNMYLVSTNEGFLGNYLNVYEVSSAVTANPQLTVQLVPADSISSPGNAVQNGSATQLETGDSRGMDGFYLNGTLHYVHHVNVGAGFCGVNYARLTKSGSNWTLKKRIIKAPSKEYAFPSVQSAGTTSADQSAFVSFNFSSSTDFPGMNCVYVDHDFNVSSPTIIKAGTGYASVLPSGGVTRWGDYTGLSRIQNSNPPAAWAFGMFGNTNHTWTNYFAKITSQGWVLSNEGAVVPNEEVTVYPNPVKDDFFSMELKLNESGKVDVVLTDLQGRFVRTILADAVANEGENVFTFNKGALAPGTYFLQVSLNKKIIRNEKLLVAQP